VFGGKKSRNGADYRSRGPPEETTMVGLGKEWAPRRCGKGGKRGDTKTKGVRVVYYLQLSERKKQMHLQGRGKISKILEDKKLNF